MGIFKHDLFAMDVKSIRNVNVDYDSYEKSWDVFMIGDNVGRGLFTHRIACGSKEKATDVFEKVLAELIEKGWGQ